MRHNPPTLPNPFLIGTARVVLFTKMSRECNLNHADVHKAMPDLKAVLTARRINGTPIEEVIDKRAPPASYLLGRYFLSTAQATEYCGSTTLATLITALWPRSW